MLPLSKARITVDEKNVNPLRAAEKRPLARKRGERQGENTLKLALACIMEYIKVGKEGRY